jgi:ABC-type lipoprotein release transport system permease subunit
MERPAFGESTTDATTFAATAGLIAAVGALACWLPARRASRIDPMTVMREQ